MNKIIELKNVCHKLNEVIYIKNINLSLYNNQNVVIKSFENDNVTLFIDLIAGNVKINSGELLYGEFQDNRYFLGYQNFDGILNRELVIGEIIKTLIKSQTSLNINQVEVDELIKILSLEHYLNDLTSKVSQDVIKALNLLLLLIIRPRIILLNKLELIGSSKFQISALEYIKNYCKSYEISMLVYSNEELIANNFADRLIEIENGCIIKDTSIKMIETYCNNHVDNNTVKFNLEEDIIEAVNSSNIPLENFTRDLFDGSKQETLNYQIIDELVYENQCNLKSKGITKEFEPKEKTEEFVEKFKENNFDNEVINSQNETDELKSKVNVEETQLDHNQEPLISQDQITTFEETIIDSPESTFEHKIEELVEETQLDHNQEPLISQDKITTFEETIIDSPESTFEHKIEELVEETQLDHNQEPLISQDEITTFEETIIDSPESTFEHKIEELVEETQLDHNQEPLISQDE
ncbi:MAG: hypothetical protein ACRC42_02265, partial [Mycoplasma sp.]